MFSGTILRELLFDPLTIQLMDEIKKIVIAKITNLLTGLSTAQRFSDFNAYKANALQEQNPHLIFLQRSIISQAGKFFHVPGGNATICFLASHTCARVRLSAIKKDLFAVDD